MGRVTGWFVESLLTELFDLTPLSPLVLATILAITLLYVIVSEASKRRFYSKFGFGLP